MLSGTLNPSVPPDLRYLRATRLTRLPGLTGSNVLERFLASYYFSKIQHLVWRLLPGL